MRGPLSSPGAAPPFPGRTAAPAFPSFPRLGKTEEALAAAARLRRVRPTFVREGLSREKTSHPSCQAVSSALGVRAGLARTRPGAGVLSVCGAQASGSLRPPARALLLGAHPPPTQNLRPAYSFSSWGLCRTPFPSTSPKCLVASTGPPGGAPLGSFSSNLSLASRLFLQACYLFSWNVLCFLLLNLLLMLLLSCFGSHVFILHLTPANRVVEPDYFTNVHGS